MDRIVQDKNLRGGNFSKEPKHLNTIKNNKIKFKLKLRLKFLKLNCKV